MTQETPKSDHGQSGEKTKDRRFDLVTTSAILITSMVALGLAASLYDDVARYFQKPPTTGGRNLLETPALSVDIFQADDKLMITVPPHAYVSNIVLLCGLMDSQFPSDCTSSLGPLENKGPFGEKEVKVILPVRDGNVILGGFMGSEEPIPEVVSVLSLAQAGDRFTSDDLIALTLKIGKGTLTISAALAALWLAGTGYKRLSAAKQAKLAQIALQRSQPKQRITDKPPKLPQNGNPKPNPLRVETNKLLETQPGQIVQTKSPAKVLEPLLKELVQYPTVHPDGTPTDPPHGSDEDSLQQLKDDMYLRVDMPEQIKPKKQPGIWSH